MTRVKLWDIGNDISNKLFEVTDITIAQFSSNGQYLTVGRRSENVVELWNLEDGESTHWFPYSPGYIRSLHFFPTSDCLMAAFEESHHKCLWRLSQTSFGHISINSSSILTVLMATESPWKDLSIDTSHVSRQSIMAEILGRSTGNHYGTIY